MSDALFGADAMPAEAPQQEERRTKLYGYDAVAAQMLEPYGESPLDQMSLEQLWKGTAKGNRKTAYHSHLAAPQETDPWHVGAGISMTAAALLAAVKHFRCQTRPRPPLTQIRNVVSKEETCPKRFSQKDSLKKILSKISLFCQTRPRPPLTQIRNVVPKEETCPKRFSQKDSLKTILSKRFSQKDSLKTFSENLLAPKEALTVSTAQDPFSS